MKVSPDSRGMTAVALGRAKRKSRARDLVREFSFSECTGPVEEVSTFSTLLSSEMRASIMRLRFRNFFVFARVGAIRKRERTLPYISRDHDAKNFSHVEIPHVRSDSSRDAVYGASTREAARLAFAKFRSTSVTESHFPRLYRRIINLRA